MHSIDHHVSVTCLILDCNVNKAYIVLKLRRFMCTVFVRSHVIVPIEVEV